MMINIRCLIIQPDPHQSLPTSPPDAPSPEPAQAIPNCGTEPGSVLAASRQLSVFQLIFRQFHSWQRAIIGFPGSARHRAARRFTDS
jgi:hypothetical protein